MEKIEAFKTIDGKIFGNEIDAADHEKTVTAQKKWDLQKKYIKERLTESSYGHLFRDGSRRGIEKYNVDPTEAMVVLIINDRNLILDIINNLPV